MLPYSMTLEFLFLMRATLHMELILYVILIYLALMKKKLTLWLTLSNTIMLNLQKNMKIL